MENKWICESIEISLWMESYSCETIEMKTSAFNDSSHFTFNWNIAKTVDTGIDMDDESCEWSEELWIF